MQAFISHSGPDDRYVAEFVQLVRSLGFDEVFNDSHTIEPDEKFWERIERGIRECDAFVVILSQASVKSCWVDKEVQFARSEGRRVIPIRIDDCKLPGSFDGRDVIELKHSGKGQRLSPPRFIHHAAEHFFGREPQLALLDTAWTNGTNVLSIIAWGGVGKTALITEWVQTRFIEKDWKTDDGQPALDAYFDWTFYDQGTSALADGTEARTGSVGDFFEQALVFFGDPDPNLPGKGRRLADRIRLQRSLIILDGLEPLQQPPGHPQAGRLLDPDLRDLLAAIAQSNPGLCLITSRQALADLHSLRRTIHKEHQLEDLPVAIAIRLLRQLQIKGSDQELSEASEKFGCHALSLTLLGRYLCDAHDGDIHRVDHIDLQRADVLTRDTRQRSVWRVLESYEHWLSYSEVHGNRNTLAVLRLVGLFDRAASAECLAALREAPAIESLTDSICGISADEWSILLKRLDKANLIKVSALSRSSASLIVDAHPLVREYFSKQLERGSPDAYRAAHLRLYRQLTSSSSYRPDKISGLQPLYQAVVHGCRAGLHSEVYANLYRERIQRGTGLDGNYNTNKLGAVATDLTLLQSFFVSPWNRIRDGFSDTDRSSILNTVAYDLRSLGRLRESIEPMLLCLENHRSAENWDEAAVAYASLGGIHELLGDLDSALDSNEKAVLYADRKKSLYWPQFSRANLASTLHQMGSMVESGELFAVSEEMQATRQPKYPQLYGLWGFQSVEHLLAQAERLSWKLHSGQPIDSNDLQIAKDVCRRVVERASQWISWRVPTDTVLTVALDECALARSSLFASLLGEVAYGDTNQLLLSSLVRRSITNFREANRLDYFPIALLTAAYYEGGVAKNLAETAALLDETQHIAESGSMPLYLADVHLHRARLFGRMNADERKLKFPDIDPKAELREARRLIEKHGYWRRRDELEDAEVAAENW